MKKTFLFLLILLPLLSFGQNSVQYEKTFLTEDQRTELKNFTAQFGYVKSPARYLVEYGQTSVSYPVYDKDGETCYILFRQENCETKCFEIEVFPIISQ